MTWANRKRELRKIKKKSKSRYTAKKAKKK